MRYLVLAAPQSMIKLKRVYTTKQQTRREPLFGGSNLAEGREEKPIGAGCLVKDLASKVDRKPGRVADL
jgi:hypothetical protein